MMSIFLGVLFLFGYFAQIEASAQCSFPAPASTFTYEGYSGKWFEIGKIQTKGGAFFEKDCVCTELNIAVNDYKTGDGVADNDCRSKTIDGKWTNATGTLYDANPPGKWLEQFSPASPSVNYTVIALGSDYAVEYDCGTSFGLTNYCVHVMSRTRTMDSTLFQELIAMAESMGLNSQNLPVTMTKQEGC
jgi:apolipoprotein D and lipocalin family protein